MKRSAARRDRVSLPVQINMKKYNRFNFLYFIHNPNIYQRNVKVEILNVKEFSSSIFYS